MKCRKPWISMLMMLSIILLAPGNICAKDTGRKHFHSKENAYSFEVPSNWVGIPEIELSMAALECSTMWKSPFIGTIPNFETGFQTEEGNWFQFPYVIVAVFTYSSLGYERQIYEREFNRVIDLTTGVERTTDVEALDTKAREIISDFKVERETNLLGIDKRHYVVAVEIDTKNRGKVKGEIIGFFGKRAVIQLMFYDQMSNWNKSRPERDIVFSSFQFDPNATYDEAYKEDPSYGEEREHSPGVVGKVIFWSIIALVISIPWIKWGRIK